MHYINDSDFSDWERISEMHYLNRESCLGFQAGASSNWLRKQEALKVNRYLTHANYRWFFLTGSILKTFISSWPIGSSFTMKLNILAEFRLVPENCSLRLWVLILTKHESHVTWYQVHCFPLQHLESGTSPRSHHKPGCMINIWMRVLGIFKLFKYIHIFEVKMNTENTSGEHNICLCSSCLYFNPSRKTESCLVMALSLYWKKTVTKYQAVCTRVHWQPWGQIVHRIQLLPLWRAYSVGNVAVLLKVSGEKGALIVCLIPQRQFPLLSIFFY